MIHEKSKAPNAANDRGPKEKAKTNAHIVAQQAAARLDKSAPRAILFEAADADATAAWRTAAASLAERPPRITRGAPLRCDCDLCGRAGRRRHRVTLAHLAHLAHLVQVPPLGVPTLSLLGANACCRCAGRVRAGDAALIESLKASRRERVRERILSELLRVVDCGGEA